MADGKTLTTIIDIAGRVDKSLGSSVKTALKLIDNLTVGVDKLMGNITSAIGVGGLAGIGVGIFAAVEAGKAFYNFMDEATQKAIDFEDEMASVVKVTDGMRDAYGNYTDMYYEARKDLFNIVSNIPVEDMTELTDAMTAVAQDGTLQYEEYAKAVEDATKAGLALDLSIGDAAKILSTFRVDLHMTEDEAFGVAKAFNYLGERSARTPAELAQIASGLAGISQIAGMSTNQIIAMATAIPELDPSRVTTSMKNFITALEKGEFVTGQPKKALDILGLDPKQLAKTMQEDAVAGLNLFYEKFGQLEKDQKLAVLDMFGGTRGLESISKLLENFDIYQRNLEELNLNNQLGSIDREVESRKNTVKGLRTMLEKDWEGFQIEIGDNLLPAFMQVYKAEKFSLDFLKQDAIDLADAITKSIQSATNLDAIKGTLIGYVMILDNGLKVGINIVNFLSDTAFPFMNNGLSTIYKAIGDIYDRSLTIWNLCLKIGVFDWAKTTFYQGVEPVIQQFRRLAELVTTIKNAIQTLAKTNLSGIVNSGISGASSLASKAAGALSGGSSSAKPKGEFASGGFASTPSIFGEAGLEAAISFDPKYRSRNIGIWTEAGRMLGMSSDSLLSSGSGDGGVSVSVGNVTYEIIVHEGTKENVVKALRESEPEFADMLIDTIIRYKRGAYVGSSI